MTKIRVISRKNGGSGSGSTNAGAGTNGSRPVSNGGGGGGNGSGQFNVYDYLPLIKKFNGNPDDYIDSQFQKPPVNIPKRSIALAIFLCCTGTLLIGLGVMYLTGYLSERFADRVWPMMIMGCLLFTPGFYHVRIAYYAYKGVPGYSFEDIPEFE